MRVLLLAILLSFSLCVSALASESPEESYQNAIQIWQFSSPTLAVDMWKELAIEHNHIPSMWSLVMAYMQGIKVDRDVPKAMHWLTKLSDLGQADAKEMLGDMYYYGRGVPQSYTVAAEWYVNYFEVEQDADILMRYATLLATGQGVTKNLTMAWKITYTASKNNRYKISSYLLSLMILRQMNTFEQLQIRFFMNQQQNN